MLYPQGGYNTYDVIMSVPPAKSRPLQRILESFTMLWETNKLPSPVNSFDDEEGKSTRRRTAVTPEKL